MKKMIYLVVVLLICSSFAAIGIGKQASIENENLVKERLITDVFSDVETKSISYKDQMYTDLSTAGTNGYLYKNGEPVLPISKRIIELPFGTKIKDIECNVEGIKTKEISYRILSAPKPVIDDGRKHVEEYEFREDIYGSEKLYPNNWYQIYMGAGLNEDGEHKTFINIRTIPVRYSPATNTIKIAEKIELNIEYEEPKTTPFPKQADYDLVIIAPSEFGSELNRLVEHKNRYEVETFLKTTEEIYSEYDGFDKPEKIKYFIKDAIETFGIKYVMLVGGLNSLIYGDPRDNQNEGSKDWYLPVRYTYNREGGSVYDPGYISDLYYADIYKSDGSFSSWDEDKYGESDGFYAVWRIFLNPPKDVLDLYPDVYVGRLACRNKQELKGVVTKIIDYERLKHRTNWFDNMIGVGGDSHDDSGTNYVEGEVACDFVFENHMNEFNPIKIYASNKGTSKPVPKADDIIGELNSNGAGHLLFEGHGHPGAWDTHYPGEFENEDGERIWVGGLLVEQFFRLNNDLEFPVCVIGGCHNSQFNVSMLATMDPNEDFMWTHGKPVSECFAWHLVRLTDGGTIGSIGNTGLGYGAIGNRGDLDGDGIDSPDTLEAVGGYQIRMFYESLDEGAEMLGEAWAGAINKYLDTWPGMEDQTDCKHAQQWPLLGDPSLKIGGYQTDGKSKSINIENYPIFERLLQLPILQRILAQL